MKNIHILPTDKEPIKGDLLLRHLWKGTSNVYLGGDIMIQLLLMVLQKNNKVIVRKKLTI